VAEKFGLTHELTAPKVEATSDDLLLLLDTLWTRAEDIPCSSRDRMALHSTLILAGIGFRPGSIMQFLYNQVSLQVIRDLESPDRMTIAATVTVFHEKRETGDPNATYVKPFLSLAEPLLIFIS
jgi:hypothetical protein